MKAASIACTAADAERTVQLYARFQRYARRKKIKVEQADDFASWAIIRYLESGRSNAEWLFVDYVRATLGDSRTRSYEHRHALLCPLQLQDEGSTRVDFESRLDAERFESRVLLELGWPAAETLRLHAEGWKELEIADFLGVTESRISQRLKHVKKHLNLDGKHVPVFDDKYALERRVCRKEGCPKTFKVLPKSDRRYCSAPHDPAFHYQPAKFIPKKPAPAAKPKGPAPQYYLDRKPTKKPGAIVRELKDELTAAKHELEATAAREKVEELHAVVDDLEPLDLELAINWIEI